MGLPVAVSPSDVKDVTSLTSSLLNGVASVASSVFKLGETWYNDTPQTVEEIKFLLANAARDYRVWEKIARQYGLTSDETLRSSLQDAKVQLQREEDRLKGLERGCGPLCLSLRLRSGTKVPDQLKQSIINLNTAISSNWKFKGGAKEAALGQAVDEAKAHRFRFGFRRDRNYVRIPKIESKLKDFLNHGGQRFGQAQVVFLYGRAGSGKSSMARQLALDYQEAATHNYKGAAFDMDGASTSNQDGVSTFDRELFSSTSAEGCRKFDRILYLKCGSDADLVKKQVELLDMLPEARTSETANGRYTNLVQEEVQDANKGTDKKLKKKIDPDFNETVANKRGKSEDHNEVESLLIQFLKNSFNLIIFDDVWEGVFLNGMVKVCGERTKVLVTAQNRDLSNLLITGKDPLSIFMDQIVPEDSLKILKVLTGFLKDDMIIHPDENVEKCMKELVKRVEGHPHALASFAAKMDKDHKEDLLQWHDVIDTYERYFDVSQHLLVLHGVLYERSVFDAIEVKFARLGEQERRILDLMALLRGPVIHEAVVQYLHQALDPYWPCQDKSSDAPRKRLSIKFRSARKGLEDFHWIKTCYDAETKLTSWSMHSLDEHFIQHRRKDDIQRAMGMMKELPTMTIQGLRKEPQPNAALLVAASYFKDGFGRDIHTRLCVENSWDQMWPENRLNANVRHAVKKFRQVREEGFGAQRSETYQLQRFMDQRTSEDLRSIFKNGVKKLLKIQAYWWSFRVRVDREDSIPAIISTLTNNIRDGWSSQSQKSAHQMLILVLCHCLEFYNLYEEKYNFGDALKDTLDSSLLSHQRIILLESALRNSWWISKDCMLSILGLCGETKPQLCELENISPLSYEQMKELLIMEDMSSRFEGLCALGRRNIAPVLLKTWTSQNSGLDVRCFTAAYFLRCLRDHGGGFFEDQRVDKLLDYAKQELASICTERDGIERIAMLWRRVSLRSLLTSCKEPFSIQILVGFLLLIFMEAGWHHDAIVSGLQQMFTQSSPPTYCWWWTLWRHSMASSSPRPKKQDFNYLIREMGYTLPQIRIYLRDWDGALEDLGRTSKSDGLYGSNADEFWYREKGTVKRMMGDYRGALVDLDKAFQLESSNYEMLKQRGFVKFLMHNEDGARADLEKALPLRPSKHELDTNKRKYYSTSIVQCLGYQL